MIRKVFWLVALLSSAVLLAASCSASVVTVTESNLNGWSWTSNYGISFMSNGGPVLDDGVGFKYGNGAFYGECGYNGGKGTSTPTTHWLGTDTHAGQSLAGVSLSAIKELKYSTYVSKRWTIQGGAGEPKYPRMPFMLQLTIQDAGGNRRQLWHRPWYDTTQYGVKGNNYSDAHIGKWEDWDAIGGAFPGNQWYEPITNWSGPWSSDDPLSPGVIQRFPDYTLVPTGAGSAGWNGNTLPPGGPTSTATGKCLNFEIGARIGTTNIFGASQAWYQESVGAKAYVDNFTLGVDLNSNGTLDPAEEITYNFETDKPAPRIVAANGKAFYSGAGNPKHLFRQKILGRVLSAFDGTVGSTPIPDPTPTEFWIWDGSMKADSTGAQIKSCWQVVCPDNTNDIWPGQWISAVGRSDMRFYMKSDPSAFWTNMNDISVVFDIGE